MDSPILFALSRATIEVRTEGVVIVRTRRRPVGIVYLVLLGLLGAVMLATTVQGATGRGSPAGPAAAAAEPLDLLWISDSSGWGAASFYARRIRTDLGVDVRVEDRWEGDLSAAAILYRLRTPGHEWLPLIRNAEVIFVTGNPVGLVTSKGGDCVTSANRPLEVSQRQWRRYIAGFRAIYRRIFQIRSGKPVILRTGNWYTPAISHVPSHPLYPHFSWDQAGITDICVKSFETFSWAISQAAKAYHVPVADVYRAFNGRSHREDPVAKGYIQADGIHPSNRGRAVIAKTLAALGYGKVAPPR